jgi:parallel beta-helix repeat protein
LCVTAASGLESVPGASLTINGNNGASTQTGLSPGLNTIDIAVSLDRENGESESRTYTIEVYREKEAVIYVSGSGDDNTGTGESDSPYKTVSKALDKIKTLGLKRTDSATIIISGTVSQAAGSDGMVKITDAGYPRIILRGPENGPPGVLDATGKNSRVLHIANGNTVTLEANLTLRKGSTSGDGGGGVMVTGGSTFNMTGGTIADNKAISPGSDGGGVMVTGGSTFNMTGGTIEDNEAADHGGGVMVTGGSTFNMTGGTIEGNEAADGGGGGVVVIGSSEFTMSGNAVIQNNTAKSSTDGGGGVYVAISAGGSIFTMTGGFIRGNEASSGGGVFIYGTTNSRFTKTGGVIYGDDVSPGLQNTSTSDSSHAIRLRSGKTRNTTTDENHNLHAEYSSSWSYGDTEGNW